MGKREEGERTPPLSKCLFMGLTSAFNRLLHYAKSIGNEVYSVTVRTRLSSHESDIDKESYAIAKITEQSAIYRAYGCPDSLTTPMATFPKILWTFVPMVLSERALVSFYRLSIVTFPLSLRVSEILPLLFSSMPLFPYPTSSLPKISPCSPGGSSFGYKERIFPQAALLWCSDLAIENALRG